MKMVLSYLLVGLLAATSFLTSCDVDDDGDSGSNSSGRQWTYMVYMGADNNLSSAGIWDIEEMGQVGSSSRMAIAVQAEFSPNYTEGVLNTNTYRLLVQSGSAVDNLNAATDIGSVDMGSRAALTDFIQWATSTYPAQHYALILWDHGAGWKERAQGATSSLFRGAIQDETAGTFMSLSDLAGAVRDAGVDIDLINFDACLMAMYEVAYEFDGLADYMVFSEETEPGGGDPYDTILADLAADPSMSAAELANVIVTRYDESYVSYLQEYPGELTTKSAVDMSRLAALDTAVCALGQALMNDSSANTVAMEARTNTQEYAYPANHDLYDLASYINQYAPAGAAKDAAASVMTAVENTVTSNATNPNADEAQNVGLAIYIPAPLETSTSELNAYSQLACNTAVRQATTGSWGEFIEWEIEEGGGGSATYGPGGFSAKVDWTTPAGGDCDADLDLLMYVNGNAYSAYEGQTTLYGYFSQDSFFSGILSEDFHAYDQVQTGTYIFYVHYYYDEDDETACSETALAELSFNEEDKGSATMSLSNPYPGYDSDDECKSETTVSGYLQCVSDNYSDYAYIDTVVVTAAGIESHQEDGDSGLPIAKVIKRLEFMQGLRRKR